MERFESPGTSWDRQRPEVSFLLTTSGCFHFRAHGSEASVKQAQASLQEILKECLNTEQRQGSYIVGMWRCQATYVLS